MHFDDGFIPESSGGCSDPFGASLGRRELLKAGGLGLGVLMAGGIICRPLASAVAAFDSPRSAEPAIEVQLLQTAASLENLAISTYAAALELPFVQENATVVHFIETTMQQHTEHLALFNAQTEDLGGAWQEAPHPRYSQIVDASLPTLADAAGVVALAATLEEAATDTYIYNLAVLRDPAMRTLMARVMGVESQHLAVLQTFGALMAAGVPELVAIPTDVSALPMAIGSAAFSHALEITNFASFPAEGAVR